MQEFKFKLGVGNTSILAEPHFIPENDRQCHFIAQFGMSSSSTKSPQHPWQSTSPSR